MAKRKRLSPAAALAPGELETKAFTGGWDGDYYARHRAPIAEVAGESAASAALGELADEVARSRAEGRLIISVPLDAIDETHLIRDRITLDENEMDVLAASLRARGQQVPLEVVDLGEARYGLISGWRRLTALRRLAEETGEARFGEALCLLRAPAEASEAYLAMIEENEIRAPLSFYERARIAAKAVAQGAFPDTKKAVKTLFAAAPAPKRSKINAFLKVHDTLDDILLFPAAMPERLGLAVAAALDADPTFLGRLRRSLYMEAARDPGSERKVIERVLKPAAPAAQAAPEVAPGIRLETGQGRAVLSGPGVDGALCAALAEWLAGRG